MLSCPVVSPCLSNDDQHIRVYVNSLKHVALQYNRAACGALNHVCAGLSHVFLANDFSPEKLVFSSVLLPAIPWVSVNII